MILLADLTERTVLDGLDRIRDRKFSKDFSFPKLNLLFNSGVMPPLYTTTSHDGSSKEIVNYFPCRTRPALFPLSPHPRLDVASLSRLQLLIKIIDTKRYLSWFRSVPIFPTTATFHLLEKAHGSLFFK